jgi:hypothetical protein
MLDEIGEEGERRLLRVGLRKARKGDFNFWRYIYERIEGKIPDVESEPDVDLKAVARRMAERRKERERLRQEQAKQLEQPD